MNFDLSKEFAVKADATDPLKEFRDQFFIPKVQGKEAVYLCGNSLGLQPKSVKKYIEQELEDWANLGVEGHFVSKNPWLHYHKFLSPLIAEVVGAKVSEVVVANSLTVNLHLLLTTFYRPQGQKIKILTEYNPFSSDLYALESQAKLHGLDAKDVIAELKAQNTKGYLSTEYILEEITRLKDELALVLLGGVNFLTGQAFDMKAIIKHAHSLNIPVGLDLAHAVGNLKLELHDWEADFAVWCSYKYLNSGPGGTGGYFIHEKHAANKELPRMAGWWGHDEESRFKMAAGFDPMPTAEGWQLSNAPVLSMAAQWASLDVFVKAGMESLRKKSLALTAYLEFLLTKCILESENTFGIEIFTPSNPEERGCQLSLRVKHNAKELNKKLAEAGFIVDFRHPDIIRVSPTPLYNRFIDVYLFVEYLKE